MPDPASSPAAPVISHGRAVWRGDRRFDAGPEGRTHLVDGDAKVAPGPVETVLDAIATCTAVDVLDILAKRRTPVEAMTIDVIGHRRSEQPRRLMRVELEYRIRGAGIEREHAERAIKLALEKYCSVAASLAPDIGIETRLVLE